MEPHPCRLEKIAVYLIWRINLAGNIDKGWVSTRHLSGKFYTYALFDVSGKIFYIGKGKNNRINSHVKPSLLSEKSYKNNKIKDILAKQGYVRREILTEHDNEIDSLHMEKFLIERYGVFLEGGILCNQHKSHWDVSPHVFEKLQESVNKRNRESCPDDFLKEKYISWKKGLETLDEISSQCKLKPHSLSNIFHGRKRKYLGFRGKGGSPKTRSVSDEKILEYYQEYCLSKLTIKDIVDKSGLSEKTVKETFAGRTRPHLMLKDPFTTRRRFVGDGVKEQAKLLRSQGFSYGEIMVALDLPKTSVARYVKEVSKEVGSSGTGTSKSPVGRDTSIANVENA